MDGKGETFNTSMLIFLTNRIRCTTIVMKQITHRARFGPDRKK
jgi:hypothetical protein